ncbi:flagellar assembly protein FliW [Halobacillus sp. Cin3]|uniref:flagellar assembly protein FliW n=1 Tax=Halobacillus sp. Cin3 TaxID=2928441 RepID=UPI00248F1517|nr:flagellar assembly protein FliW [Halobacillus sp. Cin3]
MNINTKHFGELAVEEKDLLTFKHGLPGFEDDHTYVLLPVDENGVYYALQSVDEAEVALIVTNPYLFFADYEFHIEDAVVEELGLNGPEDVAVYSVLTLKEPFKASTINLKAPIVVNVHKNKAKQVILKEESYQRRQLLLTEEKGGEADARP